MLVLGMPARDRLPGRLSDLGTAMHTRGKWQEQLEKLERSDCVNNRPRELTGRDDKSEDPIENAQANRIQCSQNTTGCMLD